MNAATPSTEAGNSNNFSFGQKIAWIVFLATSLHLAFLTPSINLIPGERAKVFSGILCALSLILALFFGNRDSLNRKSPEIWISLALLLLALLSTCQSSTPGSSAARAFVIMSSGLGGFWCARLLIKTHARKLNFQWFCLLVLAALLIVAALGKALSGNVYQFLDYNWHPFGSRIMLLSFAPLALCFTGSGWKRSFGFVLLSLSYAVFVISGSHAGAGANVVIPAALCLLVLCLRKWRPKQLAILLVLMLIMSVAIAAHYKIIGGKIDRYHQSIAYRTESIFFSWHIAKQKWLLGNGLWAPREKYLENYSIKYPYITKARFTKWIKKLRTSENNFLTFMVDLGFPFVIIYSVSLIILLRKLLLLHFRHPPNLTFHPMALLLPFSGALLHLMAYEGLYQPQVTWYFHILLGLIPTSVGFAKAEPHYYIRTALT